MKKQFTRSLILSSSLLLALTAFSSCGKDKEVKSNPPTAQEVPADQTALPDAGGDNTLTQPTTPAPNVDNSLPQAGGTVDNETLPDLPPIQGGGELNNGAGNRGGRGGGQANLPAPGTPGTALPSLDQQIAKKESLRAYQVDFSKASAIKTGAGTDELFYTSAGDDGLMEEFKKYNSKVSTQQQAMNTNLAKAVVTAKLSRATGTGKISLTLAIDEFGTVKTYALNANSDGEKMALSLSKTGTTGEMPFEGGFLKCLDTDGSCNVAYAKIKIAGGYTRVIFRNTVADLHFLVQEKVVGNSAFSTMDAYISNSVHNLNVANKIEGMKLSSFEVIGGRAGLGAMLTTLDRQVVGFDVPLVVSGLGADVNTNVEKKADLSKLYDLVNLTKSHSVELSRSIKKVQLVNNDGRGHFKLQLMFGTDDAPASIWIVAAGMKKQTMSIEQIRIFENKLKAF